MPHTIRKICTVSNLNKSSSNCIENYMVNETFLFERIRIEGQPTALPSSVVVAGQARFTVLTAQLIRVEWAQDSQFEDRATFAFPNRVGQTPAFTHEEDESAITIKT